jgi:hypothetical protein
VKRPSGSQSGHTLQRKKNRDEYTKRSVALPPPQKPVARRNRNVKLRSRNPKKPRRNKRLKQRPPKNQNKRLKIRALRARTCSATKPWRHSPRSSSKKIRAVRKRPVKNTRSGPFPTYQRSSSSATSRIPSLRARRPLGISRARDKHEEDTVESFVVRYLSYFSKLSQISAQELRKNLVIRVRTAVPRVHIKRNGDLENINS